MAGFDIKRLVLIHGKTKSEGAEKGKKGTVGTGYFVTEHLVLTASHVVPHGLATIRVRVEEGHPKWREAEEAVWRDEKLDAALIRVRPMFEQSGKEEVVWGRRIPEENVSWESAAFPSAAYKSEENEWKSAGLKGTLYAHGGRGQGPLELDLSVDAPPAKPEGWQGISGAPVFVGSELMGIIKTVPKDFNGGRLGAVPSVDLFSNSGFLLAIKKPWWEDLPNNQWVLVLRSEGDDTHLEETIKGVIVRHKESLQNVARCPLESKPYVRSVNDILQSPESWLQFVKAICKAPIMVVDVTGFQPGIMLALGVRAVARRGVTIATTAHEVDETELSSLPFNIQETKLKCHRDLPLNDPKHPLTAIGDAIRDGLSELRSNPRYVDLPVYDAVRGPVYEIPKDTPSTGTTILVLCPFNKRYKAHWIEISSFLGRHYPTYHIARMVDIASPRLVGQALYEYIRWTTHCFVDWTFWRPNVFFELGVRLACSDVGPISLIQEESVSAGETESWPDQKNRLIELLQPTRYRLKKQIKGKVVDPGNVNAMLKIAGQRNPQPPMGHSVLPHDATYRAVLEAFDWRQERLTLKPHELLRKIVETQLGKDPENPEIAPVLYSSNSEFAEELRQSAAEYWVAIWHYFRLRFEKEIATNSDMKRESDKLANTTSQWIKSGRDPYFVQLREELNAITDKLEESPNLEE